MNIVKKLTKDLYRITKNDLAETKKEARPAARIGMIIRILRNAIMSSHIYQWNGVPYVFTGKIYEPIEESEFRCVIFDVLDSGYAGMDPSDLTQIIKIQNICVQTIRSKPLKLRRDIIVFENCVLVLGDMVKSEDDVVCRKEWPMQKHSPELAQITMCNFNYDPTARCPIWDRFINHVVPNIATQMVLQEFLGCIFVDRHVAKVESMCILVGTGSNGKSVVAETVRGIIGNEFMTSFGLDSILTGNESGKNLAKMNGKRINYCTEIQALNAGRFSDKLKTIISGEPVECRQLYGMPFTAYDMPLLMANCNSLPPMKDTGYGLQRRFLIIRFGVTISKASQDKTLPYKLRDEYAGIFNWIMDGRQRFIDQEFQFTDAKEIDKEIRDYTELNNNLAEFMHSKHLSPFPENAMQTVPFNMPYSTLFDEYQRWCIGCRLEPMRQAQYSKCLNIMGFGRAHTPTGVCIKLYGDGAIQRMVKLRREGVTSELKRAGCIEEYQEIGKDGELLLVGDEAAAKYAHVDRTTIVLMRQRGYLDGIWTNEARSVRKENSNNYTIKNVHIYDSYRLMARMEAFGYYDGENGEATDYRRKQISRAKIFNAKMKELGYPFRKAWGRSTRRLEGCVVVDPDWEYTPESAELLLQYVADAKQKEIERNAVKVEKDGTVKKPLKKKEAVKMPKSEKRKATAKAKDIEFAAKQIEEMDAEIPTADEGEDADLMIT